MSSVSPWLKCMTDVCYLSFVRFCLFVDLFVFHFWMKAKRSTLNLGYLNVLTVPSGPQIQRWGNVEWAHDYDMFELRARTAAGALFVQLASESSTVKRKLLQDWRTLCFSEGWNANRTVMANIVNKVCFKSEIVMSLWSFVLQSWNLGMLLLPLLIFQKFFFYNTFFLITVGEQFTVIIVFSGYSGVAWSVYWKYITRLRPFLKTGMTYYSRSLNS